jgi:hypothetical protein
MTAMLCDCPACRMRARLEANSKHERWVLHYMRRFRMSEAEAEAALEHEGKSFWQAAVACAAERHGLDDDDATVWVLLHAADMPGVVQ